MAVVGEHETNYLQMIEVKLDFYKLKCFFYKFRGEN